MRKYFLFLVLLLLPLSVFAFDIPAKPTGYVEDYASVLTSEEKVNLEAKISAFEKKTTNEIAVVTIKSLDGDTVENLAQEIFTKWEIGKKGKDNGVLLLVSMDEHKSRIHTGYGVEGDLTDIATSYILSDVLAPSFKDSQYYIGLDSSVSAIMTSLDGTNIVPENVIIDEPNKKMGWNAEDLLVTGLGVILFIGQLFIYMMAKSKSWWLGGVLGGAIPIILWLILGIPLVLFIILFLVLVPLGLFIDKALSKIGIDKWRGGGGFGGFGGGGFGGFGGGGFGGGSGGGRSGGGGSSGSW